MAETNYVGQRLPRYDGMQHATGKTRYVGDIHMPGMLYVKAWRSPVASARIIKVDVSRARKMPGVVAVITFRYCENIARERSLIDRVSNY